MAREHEQPSGDRLARKENASGRHRRHELRSQRSDEKENDPRSLDELDLESERLGRGDPKEWPKKIEVDEEIIRRKFPREEPKTPKRQKQESISDISERPEDDNSLEQFSSALDEKDAPEDSETKATKSGIGTSLLGASGESNPTTDSTEIQRQPSETRRLSEMTIEELEEERRRHGRHYFDDNAPWQRMNAIDSELQKRREISASRPTASKPEETSSLSAIAEEALPHDHVEAVAATEATQPAHTQKSEPKNEDLFLSSEKNRLFQEMQRHQRAINRALADQTTAVREGKSTKLIDSRLKRHTTALKGLTQEHKTADQTSVLPIESSGDSQTAQSIEEPSEWEKYSVKVGDSQKKMVDKPTAKTLPTPPVEDISHAENHTTEMQSVSDWEAHRSNVEKTLRAVQGGSTTTQATKGIVADSIAKESAVSTPEQITSESVNAFQERLRQKYEAVSADELLEEIDELEGRVARQRKQASNPEIAAETQSLYRQFQSEVEEELAVATEIARKKGVFKEKPAKSVESTSQPQASEQVRAPSTERAREEYDEEIDTIQHWLENIGESSLQRLVRTAEEEEVLREYQDAFAKGDASRLVEKPKIWGVLRLVGLRSAQQSQGQPNADVHTIGELLSQASKIYLQRGGEYSSPNQEAEIVAYIAELRSADDAIAVERILQKRMDAEKNTIDDHQNPGERLTHSAMLRRSIIDLMERAIGSERSTISLDTISNAIESGVLPKRSRVSEEEMNFEQRLRFMTKYLDALRELDTWSVNQRPEQKTSAASESTSPEEQSSSESRESLQRRVGLARETFAKLLTSQSRVIGAASKEKLAEAEQVYRAALDDQARRNIEILKSDFAKVDVNVPENRVAFQGRLVEFILNERLQEEQSLRESMRDTVESSTARKFGLFMRKHAKTRLLISGSLTVGTMAAIATGNLPTASALRTVKGALTGVSATSGFEALMRSIESAKVTKELTDAEIAQMDDLSIERELVRHESRYVEYGESQFGKQRRGIRTSREDNTGQRLLKEYTERKRKSYIDDVARLLRERGDASAVIEGMLTYHNFDASHRRNDQKNEREQQRKRNIGRWASSMTLGAATGILSGVGVGKLMQHFSATPSVEHSADLSSAKPSVNDIAERVAHEQQDIPQHVEPQVSATSQESLQVQAEHPEMHPTGVEVNTAAEPVDTLEIIPQEHMPVALDTLHSSVPEGSAVVDSAQQVHVEHPLAADSAFENAPPLEANHEIPIVTEPEHPVLIELSDRAVEIRAAVQKASDVLYNHSPQQAESVMGAFRSVPAIDAAKGKAFEAILKEQGLNKDPFAKELAKQMKELFRQISKESLKPKETVYEVLRRLTRAGN